MPPAVLPALTVLFASHNGAQTLPRMLRALERLTPPRRPWRILAVEQCEHRRDARDPSRSAGAPAADDPEL